MDIKTARIILVLMVLAHFLGNVWHAGAHTALQIDLPAYKMIFVVAAILLGPLVGGILLWTRFASTGLWVVGLCLMGSALFSVYHHYVMVSIDHVNHLPAGPADIHQAFKNSALFIAFAALAGALFAFYRLRIKP